jgi:hypothetical protein
MDSLRNFPCFAGTRIETADAVGFAVFYPASKAYIQQNKD